MPELKYGYNSLEPILIGDILLIHHKKHHQGYVNKYNATASSLVDAMKNKNSVLVQKLSPKLQFVSGGHNCHSLYWDNLAPKDNGGGVLPETSSKLHQ